MKPDNDVIIDAVGELIEVTAEIPPVTVIAWRDGVPVRSASAGMNDMVAVVPEFISMGPTFDYLTWFSVDESKPDAEGGATLRIRGVSIGNSCHVEMTLALIDEELDLNHVEVVAEPDRERGLLLLRQIQIARSMATDPGRGLEGRFN
jgi:hypothetical protein